MATMKVSAKLLVQLIELSKGAKPREIGGLLIAKKGVVSDFVLMPGQFTTHSVYVNYYDVPIYPTKVGTFHSHPAPAGHMGAYLRQPSRADQDFFARTGKFHLIIAEPFGLANVCAYDGMGKPTSFVLQEK